MSGPLLSLLALVAYAVLHSLLASLWAKGRARRIAGPAADRFYRLGYNLIAAATLLPVLAVPALDPGPTLYRIPWPWSALTILGQAAAVLLVALGLLQTDVWHFLGVRQLAPGDGAQPARLVESRLYRWVRHPLYSAGLVFVWLAPWMTTSVLALNLGLTAYICIGSRFEERRLLAEFGEAYRDYQARIPRLIPRFTRRPPTRPAGT